MAGKEALSVIWALPQGWTRRHVRKPQTKRQGRVILISVDGVESLWGISREGAGDAFMANLPDASCPAFACDSTANPRANPLTKRS